MHAEEEDGHVRGRGGATSFDSLLRFPTSKTDAAANNNQDPSRDETSAEKSSSSGFKSYFRVFGYNDRTGWLMTAVAILCMIGAGVTLPIMDVVFGRFVTIFNDFATGKLEAEAFRDEVSRYTLWFIYLFIAKFILVYIWTVLISMAAIRATKELRKDYLRHTLRQEIGYFDSAQSGSISARVTNNGNLVSQGISEKFGLAVQALSTFVSAFVVAFAVQWKLTLITLCIVPAIVVVMGVCVGIDAEQENAGMAILGRAGQIAEEVLGSVRNVHAFWGFGRLSRKYGDVLREARTLGMRKGLNYAVMFSIDFFCIYAGYSLAFWQGVRMFASGEIREPGQIVTVIFAIIVAATSLVQLAPQFIVFAKAVAAADELFATIDREPEIDALAPDGLEPVWGSCEGDIEFCDVRFAYPSRPDVEVLRGLDLRIPKEKTTAIVGASGSGKSTIVGLLERWYSPNSGNVLLDGVDVSWFNVRWLRTQIRLVQQEPVMFNGTVFQNVANGLAGTEMANAPLAEQERLVIEACKAAYAHDFIQQLPKGYHTEIGQRGSMLSGGQKQRIAIARSIVSNPRIMLLDEATSALDPTAEKIVQEALSNVAAGRTMVVIAHRLSTIRDADNIVVMGAGRIVEQGTHDQLLALDGAYARLVRAQDLGQREADAVDADADEEEARRWLSPPEPCLGGSGGEWIGEERDGWIGEALGVSRNLSLRLAAETLRRRASVLVGLRGSDDDDDYTRRRASMLIGGGDDHNNNDGDDHKQKKKMPNYSLLRCLWLILLEQRSLRRVFLVTLVPCILGGGVYPALAVIFSRTMEVFTQPRGGDDMTSQGDFWALMFFVLALANLAIYGSLGWLSNLIGQEVVTNYRLEMFCSLLSQEISFFDKPENTTGALAAGLASEPNYLQELISMNLGLIIINVVTLLSSCVLAVVWGWKLGLVLVLAALPPLVFAGYLRIRLETKMEDDTAARFAASAGIAAEAVLAIRTVSSLAIEPQVLERFGEALESISQKAVGNLGWSMFWYALSQSVQFLAMALGFWYGCRLVSTREYTPAQFYVVFIATIFSGEAVASFFQYTTSFTKARHAANHIFGLRATLPPYHRHNSSTGSTPPPPPPPPPYPQPIEKGPGGPSIECRDLTFSYPQRPRDRVLRGVSTSVRPGQFVAFVGPSGCGKTTMISLLERFYDPSSGRIVFDGVDVRYVGLERYRADIALVQQEPVLYQGSIRENIALGASSSSEKKEVSEEEVWEACRQANIADFVASLPEGLDTACGSQGIALSGGQRQRIAIARALIRKPRLLLLDEATSSLDSESERVVQRALERAAEGRSTVAVAHRLSTIREADVIYVFAAGKVVESGSHGELLALRGVYYEMCLGQSLDR